MRPRWVAVAAAASVATAPRSDQIRFHDRGVMGRRRFYAGAIGPHHQRIAGIHPRIFQSRGQSRGTCLPADVHPLAAKRVFPIFDFVVHPDALGRDFPLLLSQAKKRQGNQEKNGNGKEEFEHGCCFQRECDAGILPSDSLVLKHEAAFWGQMLPLCARTSADDSAPLLLSAA